VEAALAVKRVAMETEFLAGNINQAFNARYNDVRIGIA